MTLNFYKYQGTGNDFVLIDNRENKFDRNNNKLVKYLCDRRFGIGADGLMLLQNHEEHDFEMVYYNADGYEGSMCGNGGRCIVAFACFMGLTENKTKFIAVDGVHEAEIIAPDYIKIKMLDVSEIEVINNDYFLDTGSPHFVQFRQDLKAYNVFEAGSAIRNNDRFRKQGTNVNFVEETTDGLFVRTFERGVENETLSCGTGIVASAICTAFKNQSGLESYKIKALGGNLKVNFENIGNKQFKNVWLEGKAEQVFSGKLDL